MAMPRQQEPLDPAVPLPDHDAGPHGPVSEQRIVVGPHRRGLGLLGLLIVLLGGWGGIIPYVGPRFGYRASGSASFHWTTVHTVLYLVPGAVAVAWGLVILVTLAARGGRGLPIVKAIAAVGVIACGAWFVLGPEVWPIFSNAVVFAPAKPLVRFVNEVGYNLGPGLLLTILGTVVLARPGTDGYLLRSPGARPAAT
ncbi:MAG: hypothetical protein J2O39_05355 [Acidimicrobiales bacterium]|nr:hypothetical protein [Acidimicrobiales bacterium]MBO0886843.1 hypothetical protein [Acidimicrobiales bacterium]MBO0893783.1 hypothetical protein [Acidimicrobiales bacterium]